MSSSGRSVKEPLDSTVTLFCLGNGSLENYLQLQIELKVMYHIFFLSLLILKTAQ